MNLKQLPLSRVSNRVTLPQTAPAKPLPGAPRRPAIPAYHIGSITYFGSTAPCPDPLPGGALDDVLRFSFLNNLPVFKIGYFSEQQTLLVFVGMKLLPFALLPLGYLYVGSDFANQDLVVLNWFVFQDLLNMPLQSLAPLVLDDDAGAMRLLSEPSNPFLPFVPPVPYWPQDISPPPNPYLKLIRGGRVPVDGSGMDLLLGFLEAV